MTFLNCTGFHFIDCEMEVMDAQVLLSSDWLGSQKDLSPSVCVWFVSHKAPIYYQCKVITYLLYCFQESINLAGVFFLNSCHSFPSILCGRRVTKSVVLIQWYVFVTPTPCLALSSQLKWVGQWTKVLSCSSQVWQRELCSSLQLLCRANLHCIQMYQCDVLSSILDGWVNVFRHLSVNWRYVLIFCT